MGKPASPASIRGNIFDALGLEDASELQARVDLAVALTREARRIIKDDGVSQKALAARIGIDPGDLSRVMSGSVRQFSQGRLERLLNKLGCVVEITVRRADDDHPPTTYVDSSELLEPVA
ncbi:MAG: helix-turn-helix transcriptional regulator [Gemmatimonadota bacterium]